MPVHPAFDCAALYRSLDERREQAGLGWYDLAEQVWLQSEELNAQRPDDHPLCGGAVQRIRTRGATSCQYALFLLRWLGRAPEDYLTGAVVNVGDTSLPVTDAQNRLRWDLAQLHAELNARRVADAMTWAELAELLGCTPARLTNLRTARFADMDLAMRITQWLRRPAASFIHPARW